MVSPYKLIEFVRWAKRPGHPNAAGAGARDTSFTCVPTTLAPVLSKKPPTVTAPSSTGTAPLRQHHEEMGPPDAPHQRRQQALHAPVHSGGRPGSCWASQERYVRYDESNRHHFENNQAMEEEEISDIVSVLLCPTEAGRVSFVFLR